MTGEAEISNFDAQIFLGVDGGQSHTEAVVADARGNILGRGLGGPSNHAEQPGGRERLRKAVFESVGEALEKSRIIAQRSSFPAFTGAHFGMTGGADYKEQIIGEIIRARYLKVGHDAPTALFGATGGRPGIVVIAGTGSVIYGENEKGDAARVGGLGFLFSDEGSGFWLAAQTIRLAIKEQDGLIPASGLQELVLNFFNVEKIRDLTTGFYNEKVSRDEIAALARAAHEAAAAGNETIKNHIRFGAEVLVESVCAVAKRLNFTENFPVAGVGGMFCGELVKRFFGEMLAEKLPAAEFTEPRLSPALGALLLAYRHSGIEATEDLLINLEKSSKKNE